MGCIVVGGSALCSEGQGMGGKGVRRDGVGRADGSLKKIEAE